MFDKSHAQRNGVVVRIVWPELVGQLEEVPERLDDCPRIAKEHAPPSLDDEVEMVELCACSIASELRPAIIIITHQPPSHYCW